MALDSVAMLDAELAENGQDIILQRMAGVAVESAVTARGFVRGYATELIGANGITEQHSKVILSPTQIIEANWGSGRPTIQDKRVPTKGNRVMIAGQVRSVEAAVGIYQGTELVRIEMRVL